MKKITLLYDELESETVEDKILPAFGHHLKLKIPFKTDLTIEIERDELVVTYLSDTQLKEFLPIAIEKGWCLGFLPHPDMPNALQGMGVDSKLSEALDHILESETTMKIDVLMANGLPVFNTLVAGESISLISGAMEESQWRVRWEKVKSFFRLFKNLRAQNYIIRVEDDKEGREEIDTAALGVITVLHRKSALLTRKVLEESFINDGMMHVLILAPRSLFGLIDFGIKSFLRTAKSKVLPPHVSHIKTTKIILESPEPINYSADDKLMSAKGIELEVLPKILNIVPGKHLLVTDEVKNNEVFKVHKLPKGEIKEGLLAHPLPLIDHASTEEFKWLFTILRENAKASSSYKVLMVLSTLIATFGLFGNSSPVIIGAMILAPLMSPIISLSMGVLRQNEPLIKESLKAIIIGMLLGYLCALIITWMTPLNVYNNEITSRIRPNLLDLGIAVGSGVAGAYAHAKREVAKTLAGVAIAVALVPPLAVSGIGLGWMDLTVFIGAFLLLVTNLAGMVLAAALTFLLLGYSPVKLARKGLLISLIIVMTISAPLAFGFNQMVKENRIIQKLSGHEIDGKVLREVNVRSIDPLKISLRVVSDTPLDETELAQLKEDIERYLDAEIELEVAVGIIL
ncbi:DUF389 domain-containing protein [Litoribacter ruber]|uniref:DUF389 domain-containing protein n=1 Tax=Litoribacter ruber TaxID=702568 RepID=UPI001BD9E858|nr:DUF389 domain-containing protein [Litoribacter ruber]MBT0811908.1 DUF389 domain-containing protein [Litoribacter ruber]